MSGKRTPGPLCATRAHEGLDDGTLCRERSHAPGPVETKSDHSLLVGNDVLAWLREGSQWLMKEARTLAGPILPTSGPSGEQWVSHFPTSTNVSDLVEPFRGNVSRFIASLRSAHANVTIAATLRPPERAYLMHFAFAIAREKEDPRKVPPMKNVNIQWTHLKADGTPDLAASRAGAEEMVKSYEIAYRPAQRSRHTEGRAIDMTIIWHNDLVIEKGNGAKTTISSLPRNGAGNTELHHLGMSYGVIKLASDPPHWSSDGH